MKISELIELLAIGDPDQEVLIAQPTHNYWGEVEAVDIESVEWDIVGKDDMIYDMPDDALGNTDGYTEKVVIHAW